MIQAIEGGSVDLAIVDPFFSRRLKQKGYKILLELHRSNIPFITTSVVTTAPYLRDHEDHVERFLRAFLEAQAFTSKPENKPAVVKTVTTKMKITDPELPGLADGQREKTLSVDRSAAQRAKTHGVDES